MKFKPVGPVVEVMPGTIERLNSGIHKPEGRNIFTGTMVAKVLSKGEFFDKIIVTEGNVIQSWDVADKTHYLIPLRGILFTAELEDNERFDPKVKEVIDEEPKIIVPKAKKIILA